jgi:hypothetical protein
MDAPGPLSLKALAPLSTAPLPARPGDFAAPDIVAPHEARARLREMDRIGHPVLEATLFEALGTPAERKAATRAQINRLRVAGLPSDFKRMGTGKRALFSRMDALELILALSITEFTARPRVGVALAAPLVVEHWHRPSEELFVLIPPANAAASDFDTGLLSVDMGGPARAIADKSLTRLTKRVRGQLTRYLVLDVSLTARNLYMALEKVMAG